MCVCVCLSAVFGLEGTQQVSVRSLRLTDSLQSEESVEEAGPEEQVVGQTNQRGGKPVQSQTLKGDMNTWSTQYLNK